MKNKAFCGLWRIGIFLQLILVLLLLPAACSDSDSRSSKPKVKPEFAPRIIDDTVYFYIGKTRFAIPKKYMAGANHDHLGNPWGASLRALLPNFEGYEEHNKKEFSTFGWGRKLTIMMWSGKTWYTTKGYIENERPDILERNYIKKIHDLEVYTHWTSSSLLYIYWEHDNPVLRFRCRKKDEVPSPSCKGYWRFNEEVMVEFNFHLQYLPQWKTIWTKVKQLLRNNPDFHQNTRTH